MLFLYKTASSKFLQQAVELLDSRGIVTHVKQLPHHVNLTRRFNSDFTTECDIYVCDDRDFAEAKRLLISIGADNPAPVALPGPRGMSLVIVAVLAALAIGLYLFDNA